MSSKYLALRRSALAVLLLPILLTVAAGKDLQSRSAPAKNKTQGLDGACSNREDFRIGSGVYDITGPAAELGMMGYGQIGQKTRGIHLRLWSRAFVIESPCNGQRVVFVSADLAAIFQAVKRGVVEKLRKGGYGTL